MHRLLRMDPVTIVGLIASCWTLVEAVKSFREWVEKRKLQKDSRAVKHLLRDLLVLENIIGRLAKYLKQHENEDLEAESIRILSAPTVACERVVQRLKQRIQKYEFKGDKLIKKLGESRLELIESKGTLLAALGTTGVLALSYPAIRRTR